MLSFCSDCKVYNISQAVGVVAIFPNQVIIKFGRGSVKEF